MNDLISKRHTSSCEIRGTPPSCSSVYYLSELRNPVYFTGSTPSVQTGYLIILHGSTIPKCIRSFNDFIIRDGVDTRNTVKKYHRHGKKYTSLYIFYQRVCRANTLLIRTTAVRGGTDTLRIFSSGRDAAGYIRSDVSAKLKLAAKSVQGCTLLA